jgi:hypothetical protein
VKPASINLQKLVLSPTGSINLGFILREDLLLCSSYLPLGVPNWAVIYTPSGGPSTCRLARSMKGKDKNSPSGGRTKALPAGRPPLPNGKEPSANPLAGRRQRQPLSGLHIARAVALLSHRRWERTSGKHHRAGGTKGMVKARVGPMTELLEDVVRTPRWTSLEALPWRHPFTLRHFLEVV